MEENKKQIIEVLKELGYNPFLDPDNDISICVEMKNIYFYPEYVNDTNYCNIVLPQISPIAKGDEIVALAACNMIVRDTRLISAYVEKTHDAVSVSCDFTYTDEASLKQNIQESMDILLVAKTIYRRKHFELSR